MCGKGKLKTQLHHSVHHIKAFRSLKRRYELGGGGGQIFNLGSLDFKASALTAVPHCLLSTSWIKLLLSILNYQYCVSSFLIASLNLSYQLIYHMT